MSIKALTGAGIDKAYTTVTTGIPVYIYEKDELLASAYGIEGGQEVKKLITNYMTINESDKLTDSEGREWIVKKSIKRNSLFKRFLEVIVVSDYA